MRTSNSIYSNKLHKLLHGLADIHVFGIEPNDRHWEGSFTEGNGTESLLTMGDAVNKYGYPSPCAYQMEQRVDASPRASPKTEKNWGRRA